MSQITHTQKIGHSRLFMYLARKSVFWGTVSLFSLTAIDAAASTVTGFFTGSVQQVSTVQSGVVSNTNTLSLGASSVHVGDTVTGKFSFQTTHANPAVTLSLPEGQLYTYSFGTPDANRTLDIDIGGSTWSTGQDIHVDLANGLNGTDSSGPYNGDTFQVSAHSASILSPLPTTGTFNEVYVAYYDDARNGNQANLLTSTSLPTSSGDLDTTNVVARGVIRIGSFTDYYNIKASRH